MPRKGTEPGYEIGRDERGLTNRERQVLEALIWSTPLTEIAKELEISKQRVDQIVRRLEEKGVVERTGDTVVVRVPRWTGKTDSKEK